jgi:hypothetical protein
VVQPLYPEVPRFDVRRGSVAQARLLALRQPDLHLGSEHQRDLVLNCKDVIDPAVEAVGPDVHASRRVVVVIRIRSAALRTLPSST